MAKKPTNNQTELIVTELTVEKIEFKTVLNDRINLGQEIYDRNIHSNLDFDKMESDYSAWTDYNSEYLKQSFNSPYNEYKRIYDDSGHSFFSVIGGYDDNPILERKNIIKAKLENLRKLVAKTDILKASIISQVNTSKTTIPIVNNAKTEVFIVHGHDEEAQAKTARFIEKLGFRPIILHEQASSGRTIIEKIEEYSNVGFGIVLYTPCDIGGKQSETPKLKSRARQNVVFEHGFLIGKIGRNNVCALVKGDIETPNDISGVVFVNMDDGNAWHLLIAKELKSSGYAVDMNKVL